MQGERTRAGAWQEGGEADSNTDTVGAAQGGSGRTVNGAARLVGQPGQVVVPAESMADVSAHGFWKRGTTVMFDIRVVNLDAGSYLHMSLEIVRSNSLLLRGPRDKGACIQQQPDLTDGEVMALLAPWRV